ncbi:hypothetical protein AAMO2058_000576000 [Amorphochlora amoebiformis]
MAESLPDLHPPVPLVILEEKSDLENPVEPRRLEIECRDSNFGVGDDHVDGLLKGGAKWNRYENRSNCFEKCYASCLGLCWAEAWWLWNLLCCPVVLVWRSCFTYMVPCVYLLFLSFLQLACCCFKDCLMHEDTVFPKGVRVLGDGSKSKKSVKQNLNGLNPGNVDWIRAGNMATESKEMKKLGHRALFYGDPNPNELSQGGLGDCWLVSSLSCMAEYPQAVQNVFISRRYNPYGAYTVRLYDGRYDEWVNVTVDDYIPVRKNSNNPFFVSMKSDAIWGIIIEKAFAKFCSGYGNLRGGHQIWAFQAMTGDYVFQLANCEGKWHRYDINYQPPKRAGCFWRMIGYICKCLCWYICPCCRTYKHDNPRSHYTFKSHHEKYDDKRTWKILQAYDRRKALISCATRSTGRGVEHKRAEGIVEGHAYSILETKQVGKFKLLRLRNPWGTFEWKGAWSDGDSLWKKHKNVADACHYDEKTSDFNDGAFWIEFGDFKKTYTTIDICDRSANRDMALDANEEKGLCGVFSGCFLGCCAYWILCKGCYILYCTHQTEEDTAAVRREGLCFCCDDVGRVEAA